MDCIAYERAMNVLLNRNHLISLSINAVVSAHDALFHRARDALISIEHCSDVATLATTKTTKLLYYSTTNILYPTART